MARWSLNARLVCLIGGALISILLVVGGVEWQQSHQVARELLESNLSRLVRLCATRQSVEFRQDAEVAQALADTLGPPSQAANLENTRVMAERIPSVHGLRLVFPQASLGSCSYHSKEGRRSRLLGPRDYSSQPWYQSIIGGGKPCWCGPYSDQGISGEALLSYAVPLLQEGKSVGVLALDESLDTLDQDLRSMTTIGASHVFLRSDENKLLVIEGDNPGYIMDNVSAGQVGRVGFGIYKEEQPGWIVQASVEGTPFTLAAVFHATEALTRTRRLEHYLLGTALAGMICLVLVILVVSRAITRPLRQLAAGARRVSQGDLSTRVGTGGGAELADLGQAFNRMVEEVARQQHELQAASAERQRIASELSIAAEIQSAMLAGLPSAPPGVTYGARSQPSREVGGDFYDIIRLDHDRLGILLGDASGKGVGAALFSTQVTVAARVLAPLCPSPSTCMDSINRLLAVGNESAMFATVFYGVLDLTTGLLTFCNAGQLPPMLLTAADSSPPTTVDVRTPPQAAVGVRINTKYLDHCVQLSPGQLLLVFSDGITEAADDNGRFYHRLGVQRVLLAQPAGREPQQLVEALIADAHAYDSHLMEEDDMTALALHYRGPTRTLRLSPAVEELARLEPLVPAPLWLAVEELVVNIIQHSAGVREIEVTRVDLGDGVEVWLEDDGAPFDPLQGETPDLSSSLLERPIGGLGVTLARHATDQLIYTRRGTRNCLRLFKKSNGG